MAKTYNSRICENATCKQRFIPVRENQKFCKKSCKWEQWERENPRVKKTETVTQGD